MTLVEDLSALAQGLSIEAPAVVAPGEALTARLLGVPRTLSVERVVDAVLDAGWSSATVSLPRGGGLPTIPLSGETVATTGGTGVLGRLIARGLALAVDLPVTAAISWSLTDADGAALTAGEDYVVSGDPAADVGNVRAPALGLLLAPPVFEPRLSFDAPPAPLTRRLMATVTLSAGGVTGASHSITVPIAVAPLALPRLLVLFRHRYFDAAHATGGGFALVVVPHDSLVAGTEQLLGLLETLRTALSGLSAFARFVALATGLEALVHPLGAQPAVKVARAEPDERDPGGGGGILDLDDHRMHGDAVDNVSASDHTSSVFFLAAPGRSVRLHNDNQEGWWSERGEGAFTLTTGPELFAMIRRLPDVRPGHMSWEDHMLERTLPPFDVAGTGAWTFVDAHPRGTRAGRDITGFEDEISAVHFDPPQLPPRPSEEPEPPPEG